MGVSVKKKTSQYYGKGLPKVSLAGISGSLITIDGPESVGCSTQVRLLRETFERAGYPTMQIGLGQSEFIGSELQELLKSSFLCPHTMALFAATELADQIEKKVIPSLKAGFIVLADRYLFSPLFRGASRGLDVKWLEQTFGFVLKPDLAFVLTAGPHTLAQRCFTKSGTLGFWESGRDAFVSANLYDGFLEYQEEEARWIRKISRQYSLCEINAEDSSDTVQRAILKAVEKKLSGLNRLSLGI